MALIPRPGRTGPTLVSHPEPTETPQITQDWVLQRLVDIVDRSMRPAPGDPMVNPAGAHRALELIGKHLGMFKDRLDQSGPEGGPIETDDTLRIEFVRPNPSPGPADAAPTSPASGRGDMKPG